MEPGIYVRKIGKIFFYFPKKICKSLEFEWSDRQPCKGALSQTKQLGKQSPATKKGFIVFRHHFNVLINCNEA